MGRYIGKPSMSTIYDDIARLTQALDDALGELLSRIEDDKIASRNLSDLRDDIFDANLYVNAGWTQAMHEENEEQHPGMLPSLAEVSGGVYEKPSDVYLKGNIAPVVQQSKHIGYFYRPLIKTEEG